MPDCGRCSRPLGANNRRCKKCGACEHCCDCYSEDRGPLPEEIFTPAELGLDPEHYDVEVWEGKPWINRRRG